MGSLMDLQSLKTQSCEFTFNSLLRMPCEDLEHISGESKYCIQYGCPLNATSIVLIPRQTGRLSEL